MLEDRRTHHKGGMNTRLANLLGWLDNKNQIKGNIPKKDRSKLSQKKYSFMLNAPFEISNKCCDIMKKDPSHKYARETERKPITAQMASESNLRRQKWIQNGCNAFNVKEPISNPMSFWTENDVLEYIYTRNLSICSVYGKILPVGSQMSIFGDDKVEYCTTGVNRTGCMLCGFGLHMEKHPNRFEILHETHPKMYDLLDKIKNNGVTYREAIQWINDNSKIKIDI